MLIEQTVFIYNAHITADKKVAQLTKDSMELMLNK